MARKDWVKYRSTKYSLIWTKNENGRKLFLAVDERHKKGWEVSVISVSGVNTNDLIKTKSFKTKQKALVFARQYMKTH